MSKLWGIAHDESSSNLNGILNLECAILPPGSKVAAMPEDATRRIIFFSDLNRVIIVFQRYVLPNLHYRKQKRILLHCYSHHEELNHKPLFAPDLILILNVGALRHFFLTITCLFQNQFILAPIQVFCMRHWNCGIILQGPPN